MALRALLSVLLAYPLASCAPSLVQTQAAHYKAAPIPPLVLQAPPEIASKPGYLEFNIYVANQPGSPTTGLKQSDFIANASGTSLPILFLRERTRAPISLGILIDDSGSMQSKIDTVRRMLAQFINGLNPADEVFLIAFATEPKILQPLTMDHNAVVQSLSQLQPWGPSSIYDAIVLAMAEFGKGRYPSKAIILITDGMDNHSGAKEQDAITWLKATGAKFYAIGIGDTNIPPYGPGSAFGPDSFDFSVFVDTKALQDLAADEGGDAYIVPPMDKDAGQGFSRALISISHMLDANYTIGIVVPPGISTSDLRITIVDQPTQSHR